MYLSVQLVQVFTRSAAVVDGRHGGRFQMLDGNVSGEFTHLVRSQPLNQSELSPFVSYRHGNQTACPTRRSQTRRLRWGGGSGRGPPVNVPVVMRLSAVFFSESLLLYLGTPWYLTFVISPSEHYATVALDLKDRGDETELKLECRGVPAGEVDSTREGWTRFYFQAIKQTFGY